MTKRWIQVATCVSALCLSIILPVAGHAQAVYGSITGTVTDPTGAAIPNATISVTDEGKGTTVNETSNGAGEFTVQHLIVDKYDLKITSTGFKGYEAKGIAVNVDAASTVTAQLQVGATTQTVEVSADSIPVLKTDRADVSTTFTQNDIQNLPTGGRNFTGLQLLLPGAQILGWSHAADENPQGSEQIQVDGQAFGGVAYELDGTDNQDPILGIIVINPSLDALSEAKITTQNFDASFGKAVSSVVVASTKSGSNSFHGSAYDYRTSTYNQATDPWTQSGCTTGGALSCQQQHDAAIPDGLKNLFGGSVGGPIFKDKFFFFGDYQGIRQKVAESAQSTIPSDLLFNTCLGNAIGPGTSGTNATPGCDFSEYYKAFSTVDPTTGVQSQLGTIYDPAGNQYANNVLPATALSAPAIAFLKDMYAIVKGNSGYAPTQVTNTNFNGSGTGIFNANQYDARLDAQVTATAHAFGRFSRFTNILSGTQMFGPNVGGPGYGLSNYGGVSNGANDSAAAGMDFQLSPKWLYDFRLGYYRYNIIDQKNNAGVDYFSSIGIPGENVGGPTTGSGGFALDAYGSSPLPNNAGAKGEYGSFLDINRCNCPLEEREDQFQIVNNFTRIQGNHSIKFGADLRYARNLRVPSDTDRTGINTFGYGPTANSSGQASGLPFASFAAGLETNFARYVSTSTNAKEFQKRTFFYGQDTWRVTQKLTFNYGLRYELYFPEAVNKAGNGALMDLNTGYLHVAGIGGVPSDLGWTSDKLAFSPRLGLTYQLDPKTVLRAGYGRSYDIGVFGSIFGHVVTQNLPVLASQTIGQTAGPRQAVFQLATGPTAFAFPQSCATDNTPGCLPANGLLPAPGYSVSPKTRPDPLRLPLLDAWNFSIQRSLTPTLSITMAYVGNKGTHELGDGDSNNTNPNEAGIFLPAQFSVIPGVALHYDPTVDSQTTAGVNGVSANGGTVNNTLLQRYYGGKLAACSDPAYAQPAGPNGTVLPTGACGWNNGVSDYADSLDTHFNALQVTIAKQLTHGLSFTSNYQWARAFNDAAGYATWNKPSTYGRDGSVREQEEVVYGTWQLPVGRGGYFASTANRYVDQVIGHWELSGTLNWSGGLPFTLNESECSLSVPGSAPCYANSPTGERIATNYQKTGPASAHYFTPVAPLASQAACPLGQVCTSLPITYTPNGGFSQPGIDQIGNVGRNNYFGPMYINSDMAIQKNFPIHEAVFAQFRMDAFNVFNHVNPGLPGTSVDGNGSGTITGEQSQGGTLPLARYLQFSLRVQF